LSKHINIAILPTVIKPVEWCGSSRRDLRTFPAEVRARAGAELFQLQLGLAPTDWKPMSSIGAGVCEVRIQVGRQFRVLYIAKFEEAIFVLHVFEKTSRKTGRRDRTLARDRLNELLQFRRGG
jgi:phage-related protein